MTFVMCKNCWNLLTRYEKRATYFLLLLFLLPSSFGLLEFEDML